MFNEYLYRELTGTALPIPANKIVECFDKVSTVKERRELERFYALVGPAVTVESIENHREFWHRTATNADGSSVRCRANGKVKRWKTRPTEFRLPVKYGLRECFYLTQYNASDWTPAP